MVKFWVQGETCHLCEHVPLIGAMYLCLSSLSCAKRYKQCCGDWSHHDVNEACTPQHIPKEQGCSGDHTVSRRELPVSIALLLS